MGIDIDASNPQHNWILEIRRIDGEPKWPEYQNGQSDEQLMRLASFLQKDSGL